MTTGQQFEIRWEAVNISPLDTFIISLFREDHANGQIVRGIPSTQKSYLWTVKIPPLGFGSAPRSFTLAVADSQDRRYKISISTTSSRIFDSSDNYFSIIDSYIDLEIDLKKFLMQLDEVPEDWDPVFYHVIISDFDKDGIDEIVVAIWYGRPGGTILRLIKKENEEYQILSREVTHGGVSHMGIKDIPLEYQSIITTESACFGTGLGCTTETIYTYINGNLQKTWGGLTSYFEVGGRIKIQNLYNVEFQDIDNDGDPEIIYSGKETIEEYNEQTDNWDLNEELIKEIYKWNEGTKQYEKI